MSDFDSLYAKEEYYGSVEKEEKGLRKKIKNSNHYGCCFFWENNEKSFRKRMKKHAFFAKI